ncbi:MAG: DNA-processing protein DprA [Granulosicoccus sp.]
MDDNATTPISAWLTLSLAYPSGSRLCQKLRESVPEPARLGAMVQQHLNGSPSELATRLAPLSDQYPLSALISDTTANKVEQALTWAQQSAQHSLLGLDHPAYPAMLKDTADAPPLLYAKGSIEALKRPMVAIVGSRKASHQALRHTRHLAAQLAERGACIVSGLALGIDAAAHEGALDAAGVTVAVAATEPDTVYPKRHRALAQRIIESGGAIITEYPVNTPTLRWFFPQRNRIISGMSLGVLVTEASLPSGTLTTARHAMNQGREIMAVPGSIHNLQARGCHDLIKQGAALIENIDDLIDALGPEFQRQLSDLSHAVHPEGSSSGTLHEQKNSAPHCPQGTELNELDRALLNYLCLQPATADELLTLTTLSISQLSSVLGMLEIRGFIRTTSGGRYARC